MRAQIKYGVDVIKILATGGVLSQGDKPGAEQLTYEEMKVAVETAHRTGRKVAAHAHGTEGIKDAVRAGVDSIEHGSLIDAEGIEMMKPHGPISLPTSTTTITSWAKPSSSVCPRRTSTKRRWWAGCNGRTSKGRGGRSEDRVRHRCGRLSAWRQCQAVSLHGEVRHDARGSHPRGHSVSPPT